MKHRILSIFLTILFVSYSIMVQNELTRSQKDSTEEITVDIARLKWVQTNGPPGGRMAKLIQSPSHHNELYALTGNRVYQSVNKGESWQSMNNLKDIPINSLAAFEDKLFVCGDGVYYCDDQDNLVNILDGWWNEVMVSDNKLFVTFYHRDPGNVKIFYTNLTSGTYNWKDITPSESELKDLVIPPESIGFDYSIEVPNIVSVGNRIFANIVLEVLGGMGAKNGFLYISEDLGETWSRVNLNMENDIVIESIIQNSTDPTHIILAFKHNMNLGYTSPLSELLKESRDGGATWDPLTNLTLQSVGITYVALAGSNYYLLSPFDNLHIIKLNSSDYELFDVPRVREFGEITFMLDTILIDYDEPNIVYGKTGSTWALGLVKSEDNMKTWKKMDKGIVASSPSIVIVHPNDPNVVFTSGNVIQEKYLSWDGGNTWEPFSPTYAGDDLKIDPHDPNHMLLISEMTDIYESYDGGRTFEAINNNFWGAKVFDFDVARDDPDQIYVSNIGVGISEYSGDWRYLAGSPDYTYCVKIDPEDSNILYATYSPKIFENHSSVWKYSKNQNANFGWTEILRVENSRGITSLEFDESNPNRIYAGTIGKEGAIYVSNDEGETWRILNGNLTFTTIWGHSQLQVDPTDKNTVYAGTWGGGTFKTVNAGTDWSLLDKNHTFSPTCLAISKKNPNILYACDRVQPKIHRSDDGGKTWYTYYDFGEDYMLTSAVAVDPNDPDLIYASAFKPPMAHKGSFIKIRNGQKIAELDSELPRSVLEIEIDEKDSDVLYVSTHIYGVFKSTDGGNTWTRLDDRGTGLPRTGIYDIDVDPINNNVLYATALCGKLPDYMLPPAFENLEGKCGIYKSIDSGEHWTLILETVSEARGIDIDPNDNNNLYVADMMGGVWVSNDGGQNWRQENNGLGSISMTSVKVKGNYVYASTQGSGVYSGIINGDKTITWDLSRSNKPRAEVFKIQIEVDPKNPNRIYASAYPGGLLRSDDGGLHWNDKNFLTPSIKVEDPIVQGYYSFAISPSNPDIVWMGVYGKGMFVSYDAMEYDMFANGVDNKMLGKKITRVVVDPVNPNQVYVASEEGVFRTLDNGQHWEEMNDGLETLDIRSLKITSVECPPLIDSFDDGDSDEWILQDGWSVVQENGNYVLQGMGHKWAWAGSEYWGDYTFETQIKPVQGWVHVNFRVCSEGRYFLGFGEGGLYLNKQFNQWSDFVSLTSVEDHYALDQWHNLTVKLEKGNIIIFVDGMLKINYTDMEPILRGSIAFETLDDSHVLVDDISVEVDTTDSVIYAGTGGYGVYRFDSANGKWQNLGRTLGGGWWTAWERRMYQFASILFDPVNPGRVYLGHFPGGFFISEDNGHSWKDSSLGLGNDGIFSLTMHPSDPNIIWAGTYNGVAKSVDGGRTWKLKSNGMPSEQWPFTVAIDESNPNIMYASTKNGQNKGISYRNTFYGVVMKSTDGGESWFKIMNGLNEKSEFYKILIYPLNHNILFLSTSNGVYISLDAGNSWEAINNGLPTTQNQARDNVADNLALTPDNKYLVLGLNNYGVWKADLSTVTIVNKAPIASFSYSPNEPSIRDTVHFYDSSRDADGSIVSWLWEFGDGSNSVEQNPTHKYANKGDFSVSLTVADNFGSKNTTSQILAIINLPPNAAFTFSPAEPSEGQEVQFADVSEDPENRLTSWEWNFGDSETSSTRNPTHRYDRSGTYKVSLKVTDDEGEFSTVSKSLVIRQTSSFIETPLGIGIIVGSAAAVILMALIILKKRKHLPILNRLDADSPLRASIAKHPSATLEFYEI